MKLEKLVSEEGLEEIVSRELAFLAKERQLTWKSRTFDDIGESKQLSELVEDQVQLAQRQLERRGRMFLRTPVDHPPWVRVKWELYKLLCTKDPNYSSLRKELKAKGKHTETTIVSLVTAAVATHLGIAIGALVPLCALALLGILKLGQGAYCEKLRLDMPVSSKVRKKTAKASKS